MGQLHGELKSYGRKRIDRWASIYTTQTYQQWFSIRSVVDRLGHFLVVVLDKPSMVRFYQQCGSQLEPLLIIKTLININSS
jgi:hypothetical protein